MLAGNVAEAGDDLSLAIMAWRSYKDSAFEPNETLFYSFDRLYDLEHEHCFCK